MNFERTEDQRAYVDAVEALVARHADGDRQAIARFHVSADLDRDLEAAGFLGALQVEELGRLGATELVMTMARLPQVTELVASALIAPLLCPEMPRPYAVLWETKDQPARFLPVARTVIAVRGDDVSIAAIGDDHVQAVDSLYAYPVGRLRRPDALAWTRAAAQPPALRDLWRIGVAAEIVGCLDAGLQAVVGHVKDRRQFGCPLGAFQAVQHRLAECATLIAGARWLTLRAACTSDALDVLVAVAHAQQAVSRVVFDLHQFMGAMGLTLEHPLHRWTYRARLLRTDLGGPDPHYAALARAAWTPA